MTTKKEHGGEHGNCQICDAEVSEMSNGKLFRCGICGRHYCRGCATGRRWCKECHNEGTRNEEETWRFKRK